MLAPVMPPFPVVASCANVPSLFWMVELMVMLSALLLPVNCATCAL